MGTAVTSLTVFTMFGILRNLTTTAAVRDGAQVFVGSFSPHPTGPAVT